MRINSGALRGHKFETPKGHKTQPMSDRVKAALFNILGDISGKTVLDPYAGSGALAYEAISRGAKFVQSIEIDYKAYKIITKNIASLGLDKQIKATRANCSAWSDNNHQQKFDLIIADPPYDKLNLSTISLLVRHLKADGLMVLSHSGREATPTVNGVVVVDNRFYGDAALSIYRLDA